MASLYRRSLLIFAIVSAALATGLAGYWYLSGRMAARGEAAAADAGELDGDFSLLDQDGQRRSRQDFSGKFLFVYFGFTSCFEVCPQALAAMSAAYVRLPAAQRARLQPLLISVDPLRDSPAAMKAYLALYGPVFVGLTGTRDEVAAAVAAFHLPFHPPERGQDGEYRVDHAKAVYLVAPDGRLLRLFYHPADADAMTQGLAGVLN